MVCDLDTHIELCVYDGRVKWGYRTVVLMAGPVGWLATGFIG